MRNLLITIRYKGCRYHGFQVQKNATTVAEIFQNSIEAVFGKRLDIKGCSRTDTGVHANMFCISVLVESKIPCANIIKALNVNLPDDIAVTDCKDVPVDFHARYNSLGKRYVYKIINSDIKDPFLEGLAHQHKYFLDEEQLNRAAQGFVGTHDFTAFCSTGSKIDDMVRTVYSANVTRDCNMIYFSVHGNGFLYNMVRIMVGTLIEVSKGKIREDEILSIIESKDRTRAGITVPPHGLYLDYVFYD